MELGPNQRKWIAALRSGEYEQTQGCLRDNDGFCCLGVAVNALVPHRWTCLDGVYGIYRIEGDLSTWHDVSLTSDIVDLLGLHGEEGQSRFGNEDTKYPMCSLLNDTKNLTFMGIAAQLERYPEIYFKEPK